MSLVEVMVVFAILGVLLTPLVALRTTTKRQSVVSKLEVQAQIWGRQAITCLASMNHFDLRLLRGHSTGELPGLEPPEGFPGSLTLSVIDADTAHPVPWLLRVRATVSWSPFGKISVEGRAALVLERFVSMPELGTVLPIRPR